jgi:transcriptional regulator with XRE-family HTH domain
MECLIFPLSEKEAEKAKVQYSSEQNKNALFPSRLRKLRNDKGLSQEQFSKKIGVTKSTISLYETGDNVPDIKTFTKIAEYYQVSFDFLLGKSDSEKRENIDINEKLGLSDEAISQLSRRKGNVAYESVINYLITEQKLMIYLTNYLLGFVFSEVKKTKYRFLPLKHEPLAYHTKIMYSQLIEYLPAINDRIRSDFLKDQDLLNELIMEYLSKNVDTSKCEKWRKIISDRYESEPDFSEPEPDCYEPDMDNYVPDMDGYEQEIEDESEKYVEQQEKEEKLKENIAEMQDAIMEFLSYVKNRYKEGAENGNS